MTVTRWLLMLPIALAVLAAGLAAADAAAPRVLASPTAPPSSAQAPEPGRQPGQPPAPPLYPETRIAAVVNDEVISVADLASRTRMVMLSTSIPDTPEARQRIAAQVLRTLVDEKLELQEAKRRNVTATKEEIDKAIASIAQQNNLKPEQLDDVLKTNGIDRDALVSQVTASIEWVKVIRQMASEIDPVSDQEIDDTLKRLKQNENTPEARVAEIFLAVDNPQQDDEVRALAERLIEQMKQGARFSAVAQQFSQSPTAAVGGDIGWVRPDRVEPALGEGRGRHARGRAVAADPRRPAAITWCWSSTAALRARGSEDDTMLHIVQVVFPLPPQPSEAARRAALAQAANVKAEAKNCDDMLRIGKTEAPQLSSQGDLRLSPDRAWQCATWSWGWGSGRRPQPILQKNGVGVIMVCNKTDSKAGRSDARRRHREPDARPPRHAGAALSARPAARRLCRCQGVSRGPAARLDDGRARRDRRRNRTEGMARPARGECRRST